MIGRLAFAIATSSSPQVMLIDEVLGVGDAAFQERSRDRLLELAEGGCTAVIVSYAPELLRSLASRGVFLDQGRLRADGEVGEVLDTYLAAPAHAITPRRDAI
jgi:ABC-type polysaccharide/polyol phosphate transport system ATPase subunit